MLLKNTLRTTGLKLVLPVLLCSQAATASAEWWDEMDLYVGAGVGQSLLSPPTNSGDSVLDSTGEAWKVMAGVDLNDAISIEGFYSDLGRATTTSGSDVSFRMQGASAIFHYWAHGEERQEGSVALYAKAGVNWINTDMNFSRDHTTNPLIGLGAELYLPYDLSVRLEAESYYADAQLFSLSIVKRFGLRSKQSEQKEIVMIEEPKPVAPIVLDTDMDGVLDDVDQCANTVAGSDVNEVGCVEVVEEVVPEVVEVVQKEVIELNVAPLQFGFESSSLSASNKAVLDGVVELFVKHDAIKLEAQGYSDTSGPESYNKELSKKRAESVVEYMTTKNIDASRLNAVGYGEVNPTSDNNTLKGRVANRRVELVLIED